MGKTPPTTTSMDAYRVYRSDHLRLRWRFAKKSGVTPVIHFGRFSHGFSSRNTPSHPSRDTIGEPSLALQDLAGLLRFSRFLRLPSGFLQWYKGLTTSTTLWLLQLFLFQVCQQRRGKFQHHGNPIKRPSSTSFCPLVLSPSLHASLRPVQPDGHALRQANTADVLVLS